MTRDVIITTRSVPSLAVDVTPGDGLLEVPVPGLVPGVVPALRADGDLVPAVPADEVTLLTLVDLQGGSQTLETDGTLGHSLRLDLGLGLPLPGAVSLQL